MTPATAASTMATIAPRTTARSPRRSMEPEARRKRVEAAPLLGIARRPPEHVAIQGRHQLGQPGAPGSVEPSLERVLGGRLGRMELHDATLVQVEHRGEETVPDRLREPTRGADAARFPALPGGVARPRGGRVWGAHPPPPAPRAA